MFDFGTTFEMLGASWHLLKKDVEVLTFCLLGMICKVGLICWCYFYFTGLYPEGAETLEQDLSGGRADLYFAAGLFLFAYHFIGQFFNAAVVGSAARRMAGKDPNVLTGLMDALRRLPGLLVWTLVYAVLLALTSSSRKNSFLRNLFGGVVQAAFHVATYLVLPLIMVENDNPFGAMGKSAKLMGQTFGHQIVANVSLYLFRFLASLPGLFVIVGGVLLSTDNQLRLLSVGVGAVLLAAGAGIIQTLTEIFRTALYFYVRDAKAPEGFAEGPLQAAFSAA